MPYLLVMPSCSRVCIDDGGVAVLVVSSVQENRIVLSMMEAVI